MFLKRAYEREVGLTPTLGNISSDVDLAKHLKPQAIQGNFGKVSFSKAKVSF